MTSPRDTGKGINTDSIKENISKTQTALEQAYQVFETAFTEGYVPTKEENSHSIVPKVLTYNYWMKPNDTTLTPIGIFKRIWENLEKHKTVTFNSENAFDEYFNQIKANLVKTTEDYCLEVGVKFEDINPRKITLLGMVVDFYHHLATQLYYLSLLQDKNLNPNEIQNAYYTRFKINIPNIQNIEILFENLKKIATQIELLMNDPTILSHFRNLESFKHMEDENKERKEALSQQFSQQLELFSATKANLEIEQRKLHKQHSALLHELTEFETSLNNQLSSIEIQEKKAVLNNKILSFNEECKQTHTLIENHNQNVTKVSKELAEKSNTYLRQLQSQHTLYAAILQTTDEKLVPLLTQLTNADMALEKSIQLLPRSLLQAKTQIDDARKSVPKYDDVQKCKNILTSLNNFPYEKNTMETVKIVRTVCQEQQKGFSNAWATVPEQIETVVNELATNYAAMASPNLNVNTGVYKGLDRELGPEGKSAELNQLQQQLDTLDARSKLINTQRLSLKETGIHNIELLFNNVEPDIISNALKYTSQELARITNVVYHEQRLSPIVFSPKLERKAEKAIASATKREEKEELKRTEEEKKKHKANQESHIIKVHHDTLISQLSIVQQFIDKYPADKDQAILIFIESKKLEIEKLCEEISQAEKIGNNDLALKKIDEANTNLHQLQLRLTTTMEESDMIQENNEKEIVEQPVLLKNDSPLPELPAPTNKSLPINEVPDDLNFWQRHWGKLLAGFLFGLFIAATGIFTGGLLPAIVAGLPTAIEITIGTLAFGGLFGATIGLIADKVPTKDNDGVFGFLKRHSAAIILTALAVGLVVGCVLTGGILAGVTMAVGAGVASSLAVMGVSLSMTANALVATGILTTAMTMIGALIGAGFGAIAEAHELKRAERDQFKHPNIILETETNNDDDKDHDHSSFPSINPSPNISPRPPQRSGSQTTVALLKDLTPPSSPKVVHSLSRNKDEIKLDEIKEADKVESPKEKKETASLTRSNSGIFTQTNVPVEELPSEQVKEFKSHLQNNL